MGLGNTKSCPINGILLIVPRGKCFFLDIFIRFPSAWKVLSNHVKTSLVGDQINWFWHSILAGNTQIEAYHSYVPRYPGKNGAGVYFNDRDQ